MLLKEILAGANLLVPNSINDVLKVLWLNNLQAQLYRDFGFPDTSRGFTAEAGINLYALPSDCSRERITSVVVGVNAYEYLTVDQHITGNCWTIIEENLFIHPTPNQNSPAFLNYRPRPQEMRLDMQDVEPDFPEDFHEVLVYGIATRIARSEQDWNRATELKMIFDEMQESARRELRPARRKQTLMSRTWG